MTPDSLVAGWTVTAPDPTRQLQPQTPPSLSVVIPYYRGEHVIADAVRSVLEQTLKAHEIVICDDGSPDDLEAALGPLCAEVKILRQENGGIAAAMNAAARAASGDFLVQLDQDDAFLPRRLEAIAATLAARPDVEIVASDAFIEQDGARVTRLAAIIPFADVDQRGAILRRCFFLWPAIRRSSLLAVGGYDESFQVMQDWECFIRLVLAGGAAAFIGEPLYRWRLTPGSRSSLDRVANVEALVRMTSKTLTSAELGPAERATAESLLASRRQWLAREQARHALETHAPDARRRSLGLLRGSGFDRATRAKAVVALLSPRLARGFIARRRAQADPAIEALTQRGFPVAGLGETRPGGE